MCCPFSTVQPTDILEHYSFNGNKYYIADFQYELLTGAGFTVERKGVASVAQVCVLVAASVFLFYHVEHELSVAQSAGLVLCCAPREEYSTGDVGVWCFLFYFFTLSLRDWRQLLLTHWGRRLCVPACLSFQKYHHITEIFVKTTATTAGKTRACMATVSRLLSFLWLDSSMPK